jgi:Salmonella virulence plasmid 65kDa B protein
MIQKYLGSQHRFLHFLLSVGTLFAVIFSSATIAHAAFGDGTPTVANPAVFTLQNSKAKVDVASGAFTQHIALDIAPGRNGVQPDISLDYNSQNTQDSIVGYGWSLSIPYIERLNKTGTNNLYGASPFYTSSIDGELATTSTSTPQFIPRSGR